MRPYIAVRPPAFWAAVRTELQCAPSCRGTQRDGCGHPYKAIWQFLFCLINGKVMKDRLVIWEKNKKSKIGKMENRPLSLRPLEGSDGIKILGKVVAFSCLILSQTGLILAELC